MATVNYLYRSTKDKAPLTLRLLFSVPLDEPKERTRNGKTILVDYDEKVISAKTQKIVTKEYWQNDHTKQRINDIERANYQKETLKELNDLETFVLNAFYKADDPATVNKEWLKKTVKTHYNPEKETEAPTELIKFFGFYTDLKKSELSKNRIKRIKVTKNKLKRFEKEKNTTVLISKVNDKFKKDFTEYSDSEQYARSTLNADFSIIKTVCRYAKQWSLKVSPQLDNLKATPENIKAPYLTFNEIEALRSLDLPKDGYLDNARDWLIISCYTGQRISDFLRFTSDMITKDGKDYYLEFRQQKTGKLITIPFLPEARKVLEKRNGEFPRPISDQRYNEYIKKVCEKVEFNELIKGKKTVCIADDPDEATRNDYRTEIGLYPKHELVTSHIGRRSFATNYYGKVPTSVLISITGHSTEKMFLKYIHKSETDTAKDAFKYFK